MMKLRNWDGTNINSEADCRPLTPYGKQENAMREMEQRHAEMARKEQNSMKNKLCKIAELFEMDVLNEKEALKACEAVISQHAKTQGITASDN